MGRIHSAGGLGVLTRALHPVNTGSDSAGVFDAQPPLRPNDAES